MIAGSKTFTTHGRVGDVMVVMAVTDRSAGSKGISAFVVERGTGLETGDPVELMKEEHDKEK